MLKDRLCPICNMPITRFAKTGMCGSCSHLVKNANGEPVFIKEIHDPPTKVRCHICKREFYLELGEKERIAICWLCKQNKPYGETK